MKDIFEIYIEVHDLWVATGNEKYFKTGKLIEEMFFPVSDGYIPFELMSV